MESVVLQLSGPEMDKTEIKQTIEVLKNEDYHSALSRSLKKAQDDFNALLTNIIDENKKRHEVIIFSFDIVTRDETDIDFAR